MGRLEHETSYFFLDKTCKGDYDCSLDKLCINGACLNPCNLRGSCGENAICKVFNHRPLCECPECYSGDPKQRCSSAPNCQAQSHTPESPSGRECGRDAECSLNQQCIRGTCEDPCVSLKCQDQERCMTRNHAPLCVCKEKLSINSFGELVCPKQQDQCQKDEDCPNTLNCNYGFCRNPCRGVSCPDGKSCQVINHQPLCICTKGCDVNVSVCLNNGGCPANLACQKYQCVNPCLNHVCEHDTPCVVEDHIPVCKFCPPGFVIDANYGCLAKGMFQFSTNMLNVYS